MKKYLFIALAAVLAFSSCKQEEEAKVMARFVPERYDDFIFENNLIAGRIYGEALESCGKGQITSPGVDVWVKVPGALVANQRYVDELEHGKTYHKNWGNGKDCYKVGRSLGAGASAVIINDTIQLPATNFRTYEILEESPEKVVFSVSYPEWEACGEKIALTKKFTVTPDTYFVKVEDVYTFSGVCGDTLAVAAGINRHLGQEILENEEFGSDRYALWEHASDQSIEKDEESRIGVSVYVPGAEFCKLSTGEDHAVVGKAVKSGEPFVYYFGSCWNGGDIKTAEAWFEIVKSQK